MLCYSNTIVLQMSYFIGLKLWSTNTDYYLKEARRLYENKLLDYIELYVVPDTLETLPAWQSLKIPYVIHNAHLVHGFNLSQKEKRNFNKSIYLQTKQFADTLNAKYIIFHGGEDGDYRETAYQISSFNEPRALLENLPMHPLPNSHVKRCLGATIEEIKHIINICHCGFCLDFGHAVCSANAQLLDPYEFIHQLMNFTPKMFHLSDINKLSDIYDSHIHFGHGQMDIAKLKREILPPNAIISIETEKNSKTDLADFEQDVLFLKK